MEQAVEKFEKKLSRYKTAQKEIILKALEFSRQQHVDQKRVSGEPYFIHPLRVAEFLVDLGMDYETIAAALLHDVLEDTDISETELKKKFKQNITSLVDGVTKISMVKAKNKSIQKTESMRKMLIAMSKDIRVIIIKLSDKLHNMKTLQHMPDYKRKRTARECLEIYAPLADRLGISGLKEELEALSLKNLKPEIYQQLEENIFSTQKGNKKYLKGVKNSIQKAVNLENIPIEVKTRAKHIYSVYQKMKRGKKEISEIHDLLGIRIFCNTTHECYTILGIVHKTWIPIAGRFKDYIAMPKGNQYQSLHTTVMANGRVLEVQIRTYAMHQIAEYGVAAHWIYKEKAAGEKRKPEELTIINKLKDWDKQKIPQEEFWEGIKSEILKDSIYLFTPQGHVIELIKGSTPIDFAYHIHTEIGEHCVGAKADGIIIPLNTQLKNTQVIEILTSNRAKPNLNWLNFAKTSKAKNKIRHWLNNNTEEILIDKSIIVKKTPKNDKTQEEEKETTGEQLSKNIIKRVLGSGKRGIRIGEEKNMMISLANCCNPQKGDDIIGYVSRGRGIIVHRKDCPNISHITEIEERSVLVEWEGVSLLSSRHFEVTSKITNDLFSEIEGAIGKHGGHLIEGRLEETDKGNLKGNFTMEMTKNVDYKQILKRIRSIPSVLNLRPLS